MGTCALPCGLLTWPFILCRGSLSAAIQLRVIILCELPFEVLSGTWADFLGANPRFPITSHSPWGSYLSQGLPAVAWVLHESGYPLLVLELMALKPPFFSLYYCSVWSRLEASLAMSLLGDASSERCLSWAMPLLGDASLRRCLSEAMTRAVNLLTSLPWVPWGVPPCVDPDLWSTPGDGTVQIIKI